MKTLQEAYEILKDNARYSSESCEGFVYLSQIRELLEEKPKYNQSLIDKVHNREAVIEVDDFAIIKDLINFIYPDDPYLEDGLSRERIVYYTHKNPCFNLKGNIYSNKYFWCNSFYDPSNIEMEDKPRIKASEFILK